MISCTLVFGKEYRHIPEIVLDSYPLKGEERVSYNISRKKDSLEITISAKDVVSLRGCLNSILKIIETHKKISDL